MIEKPPKKVVDMKVVRPTGPQAPRLNQKPGVDDLSSEQKRYALRYQDRSRRMIEKIGRVFIGPKAPITAATMLVRASRKLGKVSAKKFRAPCLSARRRILRLLSVIGAPQLPQRIRTFFPAERRTRFRALQAWQCVISFTSIINQAANSYLEPDSGNFVPS